MLVVEVEQWDHLDGGECGVPLDRQLGVGTGLALGGVGGLFIGVRREEGLDPSAEFVDELDRLGLPSAAATVPAKRVRATWPRPRSASLGRRSLASSASPSGAYTRASSSFSVTSSSSFIVDSDHPTAVWTLTIDHRGRVNQQEAVRAGELVLLPLLNWLGVTRSDRWLFRYRLLVVVFVVVFVITGNDAVLQDRI